MQSISTRFSLVLVFVLSALSSSSTLAQALGQTDVSINFPNIIILHYPANLELDFTANTTEASAQLEADPTIAAVGLTEVVDVDAALTLTDTGPGATGQGITVQNVWAVRGITTTGDITVAASIDNADGTNGTSTITMENLVIQENGGSGPASSIDVTAPGFSLANAVFGDIVFDLDLAALTTAGLHTGILYTIEASAP